MPTLASMATPEEGPVPFEDALVVIGTNLLSSSQHREEEHADLVATLPSALEANGVKKLRLYQGFWLRDIHVPAVIALQRRFQPRHDDVIVASFPKCGTTWLNALTFATMARRAYPPAGADHPLRRLNPHQCLPFLEGLFQGGREAELEALPSPRLMNTHMPLPMVVPSAVPGCRVVYVCREPKDMAVSAWHFLRRLQPDLAFSVVFESVCDGRMAFGPVWDHVLGYWRASTAMPDKVLFLRYEELLRDPADKVRKLARFLGMPFSAAEEDAGTVDSIVRLCSFDHLKGLDANKIGHLDPLLPVPRDALFRNGASGDWVNHMTAEMASRLDRIVADKMRGTGLNFR
ncbi:hypothetical protein CFC21_026258 [Triticum aestivum]|uniref:Sulfotransferase n=3 Tax=Triticum TaxID=4564 RepID=A0A9R1Q4B0_TRITD|nr:cytosolic sulfotransferase 8-like [Triticum aestivum]KAF7012020.1 hypothetical protein CFC21_026258 [Triticum aestivum]VAH53770.1 unnamed protein product [Triticum turgidum subsp. durum]